MSVGAEGARFEQVLSMRETGSRPPDRPGAKLAGLSMKNEMCTLTHKAAGGVGFEFVVLEYEQALVLGEVTEVLD